MKRSEPVKASELASSKSVDIFLYHMALNLKKIGLLLTILLILNYILRLACMVVSPVSSASAALVSLVGYGRGLLSSQFRRTFVASLGNVAFFLPFGQMFSGGRNLYKIAQQKYLATSQPTR